MTKFYVDENGNQYGGFDGGAVPPEGAIEVPEPPHGNAVWVNDEWTTRPTVADVEAEAERRLELLGAGYSDQERLTWATQIEEARALQSDPDAAAPFLRGRAAQRQQSVAEIATRVIQLANGFATMSGLILGTQDRLTAIDPIPEDYADDTHWP